VAAPTTDVHDRLTALFVIGVAVTPVGATREGLTICNEYVWDVTPSEAVTLTG